MAGETIKSRGVCLRIAPWSMTSHVVSWLTPLGRVSTIVKGAVRPKSMFLGQYDLGYTCEIVYYARGRSEVRALREAYPLEPRSDIRDSMHALALSDRFRHLAELLVPNGPDAAEWFDALSYYLDELVTLAQMRENACKYALRLLIGFEMKVLGMMGIDPSIGEEGGSFALKGERKLPISAEVARCLANPTNEKNLNILLDATRAIGVFYTFHLENAVSGRRQIVNMISKT